MNDYPRRDWTPHWRVMNDNLIELVDLIPDDQLNWVPREGEWDIPTIFAHISLARHMAPIATPDAMARIGQIPVNSRTKNGIREELRLSWEQIERFVSDSVRLDPV